MANSIKQGSSFIAEIRFDEGFQFWQQEKNMKNNQHKNVSGPLRKGDIQPNIFYQLDKEFSERGGWYFRTRYLEETGAFETREEARKSMEMFFLLNADT